MNPARLALMLVASLACLAWAVVPAGLNAQEADQLPQYRPETKVSGTIRLWGHGSFKSDFMGRLVKSWADGFAKYQPDVKLENHMYGTASAIGALYVGAADVAILGEEISPAAASAFLRAKHYPPLEIDVATGSLDVPYFDFAHVVFVHKDNPLSRLTLSQLDGIFGTEHRRGLRNIRSWGELELSGEWARRHITPYSWKDLDFSLFIQGAVLGGSHRWNNDLREFSHVRRPDGSQYDAGKQILDALATDPGGIAISNLRFANPQVKPVALAVADDGPYFEATKENLIAQTYPLTRIVPAFIDRTPGRPADPKVREFLRYILSREGQQAIVDRSGYLQLGAAAARVQLEKLGADGAAGDLEPSTRGVRAPGTIRVWGNQGMRAIVARWREDFRRRFPERTVETRFTGTDVAMAGLYTGYADVALMGREPTASEIQAFEWIYRYKPTRIAIMRGSLDVEGRSPALAVLVGKDNPLTKLTLAQLEAIFSGEHRPGAQSIRTWGQLGLRGSWERRPIDLYARDTTSGTGRFFRHMVLHDSRNLAWDRMREFADDRKLAAAVARDPFGIAVASAGLARNGLKPVALAGERGPFERATAESVATGSYPLARTIYALVNRSPSRPLDRAVRDFLSYVLSDDGQVAVERNREYLRLPLRVVTPMRIIVEGLT